MQIYDRQIFPSLKSALSDQRVVVITGMRRVGKTTSLRWLIDQVPSENKTYLDLERLDQRAVFQEKNYETVLNYFRSLGLDPAQPMTVAIDEIQYSPNLPSVIKYLYDKYGIKFLLTGSSSFYLKNYFSESMAGRKIVYELLPLGFGEFLNFHNMPYLQRHSFNEMLFDNLEFDRLKSLYDEYIYFGGLPNVVLEPDIEKKREILNDILSSYFNLDVRVMADFRKIGELQQLLKALANRIGNKLDLTKLSQIIGISRPTLNEYLEFLEKTYMIYRLPAYAGVDKSLALGKKLYFRDNGIASILTTLGESPSFENAVFNQLWTYGELSYISNNSDFEIDFILADRYSHHTIGLEAKNHPAEADNRRLRRTAERKGLHKAWLIGRYPTPSFTEFIWGGCIF